MSDPAFRLGTRASKLARWQSDWVADQLRAAGFEVEIVEITTSGDGQYQQSLAEVSNTTGTQGLFTKEIQRALLDERVDLAVHSLKDLPTAPVDGLLLAAVPEREGVRDALIAPASGSVAEFSFETIDALPTGAKIGTGSLRRKTQLLHLRPDLDIQDIRGNVDTRLRKLDEGLYDAILLAEAGLRRLGFADRITQAIPTDVLLPAPGQGALGIECRSDDQRTVAAVASLNHATTQAAVTAERAALRQLEGGCLAALGAWGRIVDEQLTLSVVVLSEDGTQRLFHEDAGNAHQATQLGQHVANELLSQGAAELLRER